jgi:hypothetical protein
MEPVSDVSVHTGIEFKRRFTILSQPMSNLSHRRGKRRRYQTVKLAIQPGGLSQTTHHLRNPGEAVS